MLLKIKFAVLFLICIVLTGCSTAQMAATSGSPLPTATSTLSNVSTPNPVCTDEPYIKPNNFATLELLNPLVEIDGGRESPSPWDSPQIKDGLTFYIRGIYSINKDIAFIFGGLQVPGGTLGSLLLRSTDGGAHWKEVLNPINYNDITHVVFIGNGEGWAISTWTPEGDAGTRLWHTTDYGNTWQESGGHPPTTIGIKIFNNMHLQVKTLFWWANPNADQYQIWDSYDGGINWSKSFSIPVNDRNVKAVFEAYADTPGGQYGNYYQCNVGENDCIAYGQDGSKWQIEDIRGDRCINGYSFDKLLQAEVRHTYLDKEATFTIPVYFYYQDNEIHVKP